MRAEQAEKEREALRARAESLARERDEAASALLTGETDPESGRAWDVRYWPKNEPAAREGA